MTDRELLDRKGHEVNDDLPPLPEPAIQKAHGTANAFAYGYHADQMRAYARAAVLAERERSPWKMALDQELVSLHLGTTDTPGYDTPKAALDAIIQWHVKIALDPAVSSDAAALIAAERERCAKVCEADPDAVFSAIWKSLVIPGEFDAMDETDKNRWRGVIMQAIGFTAELKAAAIRGVKT